MPIQGGADGNSFYVKIRVGDGGAGGSGQVTDASIDIELEQGSGAVCSANATYFVHAFIYRPAISRTDPALRFIRSTTAMRYSTRPAPRQ